jgi:threonyl-tRNA synthetase
MAVQRLFPKAQVTIGPWCAPGAGPSQAARVLSVVPRRIENGFYYDFDYQEPFTEKDLKKIQKEMAKIIAADLPLRREEVTREEARRRISELNEPYKLEILDAIATEPITLYHVGDKWWDLCAGPHVESTGKLNASALSLETVAGAYWRGDEARAQLQRIYGTAWETEAQLSAYRARAEAAKARDHRALGKALDLFSIQEGAGGGLVFWHPAGSRVRHALETHWKEVHLAGGYDLVYSPHVAKLDLWKTSGHFDFYKESMFDAIEIEDESYQLKPMNCPGHVLIYKDGYFSYRDLPLRWAELGTVYRYERSGTMHGLFRVRGFTQDDAHIFCLESQIASEIRRVLDLTEAMLTTFGFTRYEINLSTRPAKSVGSDEIWAKAEAALREALDSKGWTYATDEGGGAFYGPKIDLKIKDAIGRKWQCSTVQVDFNLPERFGMEYTDADGERRRPIMIHRALLGSIERFFGILIENYAGAFPLWLAPVQARILPVSDEFVGYAEEAAAAMRAQGLRVEVMGRASIAKMIRTAEQAKTPIMAVVGGREVESRSLAVRLYGGGGAQTTLPLEEVVARAVALNARKGPTLTF